MKNLSALVLIFCLIYSFSSCKKEDDFNTDSSAKLFFSEDTVMFDTVFTSIGSTTQYLLVYNKDSRPLKISSIRLATGASSYYRLNVDGSPGKSFTDVEIGPKDSLWIFIEITIDPNNQTTPFLVMDSILFETNGNLQDVDLVAFGQNAHYFTPTNSIGSIKYSIIPCNAVWDSILPYVIYGYAVVDSGCSLTIQEGSRVYFYNNGGLWVFADASLKVNGTLEHKVTFQGSRLEQSYQKEPGQWDRIWINEGIGSDNEINYAVIKNGFIGLQPENLFGGPTKKLTVKNTIIENMSGFGMLSRFYNVECYNTVFANCGTYNAALTLGGNYSFLHCTFANYWGQAQRTTPAVYINNYAVDETGSVIPVNLTRADFKNSVIYGNIANELELDFKAGADSNYLFQNCLMKIDNTVTSTSNTLLFKSIFLNEDPNFKSYTDNDYRLDEFSAAIDRGDPALLDANTQTDIRGISRTVSPDLGAYERE